MADVKTRVVEGYHHCPVPFTVEIAALTAKYSAFVAGETVHVSMPRADRVDLHHQDLSPPPVHYTEYEDLLSTRPEMAPFWGRIVKWRNNFESATAANVHRFGIAIDVEGDDDNVREIGRRIAEAMSTWWAAVSSWIEVLHGQDLSGLGSVKPGIKFTDTTLRSRLHTLNGHPIHGEDGAILPVGSSHFGVTWPNYRPISAEQLQRCIEHAQRHGPPPDEWLLIRDANSLCAGHDYRRAVLDAGLAAELAVTTLIRTHLTATNHPDVNSQLNAHRMLGKLCSYWINTCGGSLPENFRQRLIERRNAATHAGMQIPKADVQDAIAVAREIVEQATPLPV